MSKKYTKEEIENILNKRGYKMLSNIFVNVREHIDIEDNNGYLYHTTMENIINNKKPCMAHFSNPYSIKNIQHYLNLNNSKVTIISKEYKNNKQLLEFKCGCGNIYSCNLEKLLHRKKLQCNRCGIEKRSMMRREDIDNVKEEFVNNGYKPLFTKYVNCFDKLKCIDKEGYLGLLDLHSLRDGGSFDIVGKYNPYSIKNIEHYIKTNNLFCTIISKDFKNSNTKLEFKCECGNIYKSTWKSFITNHNDRCETCSKKQSQYAFKVENYLKTNNLNYDKEHTFENCKNINILRFDFIVYINGQNILIEVDGETHFKPSWNGIEGLKKQQKLDLIKNKFCIKNNIKLIRIPYNEVNDDSYLDKIKKEIQNIG